MENNIWGQGDINDFTQCIYRTGSENNINFGWNWDWPNENNDVKSYPEVIYEKNPGVVSLQPKITSNWKY